MKKVLAIILTLVLLMTSVQASFAANVSSDNGTATTPVSLTAEAATLSVGVPTNLAIVVDADGTVVTATNAKIINNSHGAVKVKNVSVTAASGWSIVEFEKNMTTVPVGTKQVGFMINNQKTLANGNLDTFSPANFPQIAAANSSDTDELPIIYDATIPAQPLAITNANILNVVFTIGWDLAE